MIAAFRRLFGQTEEPVTRMTRDEALAAAADAASAAGMDKELTMAVVRKEGERLLWMVGTPTVGSGCCWSSPTGATRSTRSA